MRQEEDKNREELNHLTEEQAAKEKLRQEKLSEEKTLSAEIQACRDKIAQSKIELLDIASRQSKAHNELTRLATEIQSGQVRIRRLGGDKNESTRLLNEIMERFTQARSQCDGIKEKIDTLRQERKGLDIRLKELHNELTVLKQSVVQLKENLAGLNSRREFLEDLKKRFEIEPRLLPVSED